MNNTQPPRFSGVLHSVEAWERVRNLRKSERSRSHLEKGAHL